MTPQWAAVVISVLALLFSIYNGNKASGKDDRKEAEEVGKQESAILTKLEIIQNSLIEVKQDIKSHKEEMERAEMEKRLETTRMDLLQSQIKPHFLFNTLNTISGMAELEDAEKTDSMIRSLSRLFRYNLHTTDQFVSFTQELEVARDYLYLQQMRFGDRVQYELPDPSAPESASFSSAMIPVFLLQPLVENAVIHGIAKKEQGGKITISAGQTDGAFQIRVSDTGVGMDPETLQGLIAALRGDPPDVHVGIGIGNLYKRLETLYGPGSMQISSTAGKGTQVDITIPLGM